MSLQILSPLNMHEVYQPGSRAFVRTQEQVPQISVFLRQASYWVLAWVLVGCGRIDEYSSDVSYYSDDREIIGQQLLRITGHGLPEGASEQRLSLSWIGGEASMSLSLRVRDAKLLKVYFKDIVDSLGESYRESGEGDHLMVERKIGGRVRWDQVRYECKNIYTIRPGGFEDRNYFETVIVSGLSGQVTVSWYSW